MSPLEGPLPRTESGSSSRRWLARFPLRLAELPVARFAVGLVLLTVLVEALAVQTSIPGVRATLRGLSTLWREGVLSHDGAVSGARWLLGWAAGAPAGILLGILTGRVASARLFLEGLFTLFRAIPFICLVPLSMLLFGLGEQGKVFLVAWASASVCWVIAHQGAQGVPVHHRWRAISMAVPRGRWVTRILLPELSPVVFSALRTSLSLGLIVVAVAEMSGVYERSSGYWWSEGLGYRMFRSLDQARNDLLMAAILAFVCMGYVGDRFFAFLWNAVGSLLAKLRRRDLRAAMTPSRTPFGDTWDSHIAVTSLRVANLSASYDGRTVIDRLSLSVESGETLCIVGPSGCGKTTLLRAIARLEDAGFSVSGDVALGEGESVRSAGAIGLVLQDAPVFERLSVAENIAVGGWSRRLPRAAVLSRVLQLLGRFGIENLAPELGGRISGGQRQRVALAAAVAGQPQVLLLDEPFGALDAITRRRLQAFYCDHIRRRFSAVFVTHDIEEAMVVGDRVRIGVARDAAEFEINKIGLEVREWERSPEFLRLRNALISALEDEAGGGSGASTGGDEGTGPDVRRIPTAG